MAANDNGVIKQLVDSLTNQLTTLLVNQESLMNIMTDIKQVVNNAPKVTQQEVEKIKADIESTRKQIEQALSDLKEVSKNLQPVSTLSNYLAKPISVVIVVIAIAAAAFGVFELMYGTTMKINAENMEEMKQMMSSNMTKEIHHLIGDLKNEIISNSTSSSKSN